MEKVVAKWDYNELKVNFKSSTANIFPTTKLLFLFIRIIPSHNPHKKFHSARRRCAICVAPGANRRQKEPKDFGAHF